jgi:hypothetical protein
MASTKYVECESYKHKMAKKVLKSWFDWQQGDIQYKTDYKVRDDDRRVTIDARTNRKSGVWLEYPLVQAGVPEYSPGSPYAADVDALGGLRAVTEMTTEVRRHCGLRYKIDSVRENWDESWGWGEPGVPSFDECKAMNVYPKRVIDLVITHKGTPRYFIEICHKNPVSDEKIKELKEMGVDNLIEIDADWILNQIKRPDILKIKRWLI